MSKPSHPETRPPIDAEARRSAPPVIVYPDRALPPPDLDGYRAALRTAEIVETVIVPARDARVLRVPT